MSFLLLRKDFGKESKNQHMDFNQNLTTKDALLQISITK